MKYLGFGIALSFLFFAFAAAQETDQLSPAAEIPVPNAQLRSIWLFGIDSPETAAGICLLGTPRADCVSGIQLAFLGEDLENKTQAGLWIGWLGELKNQYGVQLALLNRVWTQSVIQLAAGANYSAENNGMQAAALINQSLEMNGFQLAALGNLADEANGLQLSVLLNQAESGSGVQLALFNVSGVPLEMPELLSEPTEQQEGFVVQVGLENYSVNRKVFQFGLYNDKSEPGFQIGLVNYSATGFFKWMPFFNW